MRITGTGPLNDPKRNTGPRKRTGETFSVADPTSSSAARPSGAAQPVAALGSLLAVQEVDAAPQRIGETIEHANKTLDALDLLRVASLTGDRADLSALKSLVANRQVTDDANLNRITDAIDLRAKVELAKRGIVNLEEN